MLTDSLNLLTDSLNLLTFDPTLVTVYDFGAVTALYSVAERLDIGKIIDDIADKREQGLPVSAYMLLAAINRAVAPTSKN